MNFNDFLLRFDKKTKTGNGYNVICPAHDDKQPSLTVTEGNDGRILLHCHASCSIENVLAALRLQPGDLFTEPRHANGNGRKREIVATYDYQNEAGLLLYQSVRFEPKGFAQRAPNGNGGWEWNLNGVRRVLYRLPQLIASDPRATVFIAEGEKDVDELRALGLVATTNSQGAGKWRDEYNESLKGREIVILPDNDRPGRDHAQSIAKSLKRISASVRILELPGLPPKGDVSNWLDTGGDAERLCVLAEGATEWEPTNKTAPEIEIVPGIEHAKILKKILDIFEPRDFHELGDLPPQFELKQKHYLVLSIRALLDTIKKRRFVLARKNDFIFIFNGEYWKEIDRDTLKDFLGAAVEKLGVGALEAQHYEFKDKLYRQFLAAAHFEQAETGNGKVLINLKNGTFEIAADSQKIREFRAEDFLKYQLPFDYNPAAKAPIFTAYLNRVLPELELQNIVAEYFGYVFTRKLKLEKALLLHGGGSNGKSVLFDLMNALLGRENTANYSLSDLMQEHNRAQIAHKLLNYGSEINASITKDIFKILVSGEQIMARLKYGNSFLMEEYAKLCFNCNELPKDIEQSEAYFRRLLIVPFRVTIPDPEQDKELAQKIIASELSGVFNWVLAGLQRLLKNKKFTKSLIVEDAISNYKREADSVGCYLDESDREPEGLLKDIYADYRNYCADSGMKPLGKQNFKKRLETYGYEVEKINSGMRVSKKE